MHKIENRTMIDSPDRGLLLGNGDLSVSVYQKPGRIVWRFGKGDVWDRRHDLDCDPEPANIREVSDGILREGWICGPYGGPVSAKNGTGDPKRMNEICQGCPPSYERRPYPCPKPVGELAMYLPDGLGELSITQCLMIEEARIRIRCEWNAGVSLEIECLVPPSPNILLLRMEWRGAEKIREPVPFTLYRWTDPTAVDFNEAFHAEYGRRVVGGGISNDTAVTPLPGPTIESEGGRMWIRQNFYPDPLFTEGFRCMMEPFGYGLTLERAEEPGAAIRITPGADQPLKCLAVGIATSPDKGGGFGELRRLHQSFADDMEGTAEYLAEETRTQAAAFWAESAVRISDRIVEDLWYETLYSMRCIYRSKTVPPGLFFPSSLKDYSHWHGDYHTNYNFQQPFWGVLTANHAELLDAYFEGMEFLFEIGRKIAHDYYGCRGAFIQLSGYPIRALDDPIGTVPMGRMAYMTGWVANQYWWRYLHTRDKAWLRSTGYPAIRDCALFYLDFLTLGDDGLYHAFPSNSGEDGFNGDPKNYTDRAQVMQHVRYCFRAAIMASTVLDADEDLREEWDERLKKCAGDDGQPPLFLEGLEQECYKRNPPEFGFGRPYRAQAEKRSTDLWSDPECAEGLHVPKYLHEWYFGQYPYYLMQQIRSGKYIAERDFPEFLQMVARWREPNGLLCAMSPERYGLPGAWTESLGIIAPLQEMMLRSWDGAIRVFPEWPAHVGAEFDRFLAEGAFLVSASWSDNTVGRLEIFSEKGGDCHIWMPWETGAEITDETGYVISSTVDEYGRTKFSTVAGMMYRFRKGF